jgi:Ser/Thr protein kinase RdoA (MazF antagonist)
MTYFPVTASVLSASALEDFIRSQYNLPNASCTLIKTFVNDSYLIAGTSGHFILRVYTKGWRSELEIHEELRMIRAIHDAGVSVSHPLPDVSGNYIQKFMAPEGDRYGVLFSFAKGEKKFHASEDDQRRLGKYLANMHNATLDMKLHRVEYDAVTLVIYSFEKFRSYLKPGSDEERFMDETKQLLASEFKKINVNELRKGAVHLDFWADNLHIDENQNITLFDFDFCGNGFLALDIAFSLLMLQSMEPDENMYNIKADAFIKGYESVTPLTPEEKKAIPLFGACICFYFIGAQSDRFSTVFFNAEHLKRFINFRLKRWMAATKMNAN